LAKSFSPSGSPVTMNGALSVAQQGYQNMANSRPAFPSPPAWEINAWYPLLDRCKQYDKWTCCYLHILHWGMSLLGRESYLSTSGTEVQSLLRARLWVPICTLTLLARWQCLLVDNACSLTMLARNFIQTVLNTFRQSENIPRHRVGYSWFGYQGWNLIMFVT